VEQLGVPGEEGRPGDVRAGGAWRQGGQVRLLLVAALDVAPERVPGAAGEPAQRAAQGLRAVEPLQAGEPTETNGDSMMVWNSC